MADNPWLERRVIAYAHQGGANEAPSSTLHAIALAVERGAPAIELDVHATADRRIVVCHDPTLERTTNGSGEICRHTLAELLELDNAYWFVEGEDACHDRDEASYRFRGRAPADHRFGIATLDEILEEFPGVVLNLDIKRTAPEVEPYEELLADLLRRYERSDDVIVASFNDAATEAFSRYAPELPTSAGTVATAEFYRAARAGSPPPVWVTRHVALQVPATFGDITVVDEQFVAAAHAAGLAVHVWTIDDPEEMGRLVDLGVDGIISDAPSVLVGLLENREVAWRP
ncbi:MAG TPA: glycerophosphodiester phosphodiesterase [Acidimicrobiales bacterium]|nr:glycerophosphodiester phosphodiesterase [Acidimicrobiales bacterium]